MSFSSGVPYIEAATRRNDVMLAGLVMMTIAMIVLPMPTPLVDMLIATNMSAAVVRVMVALYVSSPVAFSSFPSVLLLTTLFRLSLSTTTTRPASSLWAATSSSSPRVRGVSRRSAPISPWTPCPAST